MLDLFRAIFAPPRDLILLVAAGWLGLWLAGRRLRRSSGDEAQLESLTMWMSIAFVAGGRLLFAASHIPAFLQSPLSLVSLNVNLFDSWAGLASAAIVAAIIIQRKGLPPWHTLDRLVPLLATLSIGLGLSHLASGSAFGRETSVPWAIQLWGAARHPTQIYEVVAGAIILGVLWFRRENSRPGQTFLLWLALTAASRVLIEGFRGDSTLVFGGLRLAQIIAWLVLAVALLGMELLPSPDVSAGLVVTSPEKKRTAADRHRAA